MDEESLIALLNKGDRDSFKRLFERYYSPLCEYASRYVSDADAEELVQEYMVYLWENRETLTIETSLKACLFASVKYRCLNAIKQRLYHERVHNMLYEKMKDRTDDPDYYLANELAGMIRKAVGELPDSYREVFVRSRFGASTNAQIAVELGISVKTVEYRITQTLKILRVKLKDWLTL
ncbi:MAG: RNA polymerase sigma-70 factor [Tannerella sp.]|jgi:RNA polymerase sigma-70 factor (ECF subfamily)|nr:RNA polymerase sigma-70 factor [Tannerella sp.]